MTDRADVIDVFLTHHGWLRATRAPLAGDASGRRYLRLTDATGQTVVLMDADPANGQNVRPFLEIGRYLRQHGFSVPAVLAQDPDAGLVLLEDFGDGVFARLAAADPATEARLYAAAVDVLGRLKSVPVPGSLTILTPERLASMIAPLVDCYSPAASRDAAAALCGAIEERLNAVLGHEVIFCLRDCHAENLMYLEGRPAGAAVGILDFQDAVAAHPAYDLVSLLQDARRDLAPGLEEEMIERYLAASDQDDTAFRMAYRALGLQRNLRILGIFARLAARDGKPRYLKFLPRVWDHVQRNLEHPAVAELRAPVARLAPEPTPDLIAAFSARVPA